MLLIRCVRFRLFSLISSFFLMIGAHWRFIITRRCWYAYIAFFIFRYAHSHFRLPEMISFDFRLRAPSKNCAPGWIFYDSLPGEATRERDGILPYLKTLTAKIATTADAHYLLSKHHEGFSLLILLASVYLFAAFLDFYFSLERATICISSISLPISYSRHRPMGGHARRRRWRLRMFLLIRHFARNIAPTMWFDISRRALSLYRAPEGW